MGKTLFVSDFDDTLAQTDSKIFLTRKGERIEMDPAAFAVYDEQPGDKFDFSEFDKLINPKPIQRFVKLLKQNNQKAIYWHQRNDLDGYIDFRSKKANEVYNFVRALSYPYKGAWALTDNFKKVRILKVKLQKYKKHYGPFFCA